MNFEIIVFDVGYEISRVISFHAVIISIWEGFSSVIVP